MSDVAVVILNYNGKELLRQFLPSVIQHSGNARIVVADNGSNDGSLQFLRETFPQVVVIALPTNLGFCGGYNEALKQVNATYYVLLNSDVEVTPNWLQPLVSLLDSDRTIAAAQPKILSYRHKNQFEYAGAGGGFIDQLGYPFCRGRIFDEVESDQGQYNDTRPVFWATGACLFIRSSSFHAMGGLDVDFFAHMEEIDLCWRLQRNSERVYYCGASTVYHLGGGTLAMGNPNKVYLNFRNGLALLFHHLPAQQLIWKLPVRIALDWVAAIRFVTSSPASGWAVLRAHAHMIAHLAATIKKRRRYKKRLSGFARACIYSKWLIVSYFLKGQKTFDQLGPIQ